MTGAVHTDVSRIYCYSGSHATTAMLTELAGLAALTLSTLLGLVLMVVPPLAQPSLRLGGSSATLACLGLWTMLAGWMFGLTLLNSHPTARLTDDGLVITAFLGYRIAIPWRDVQAVGGRGGRRAARSC